MSTVRAFNDGYGTLNSKPYRCKDKFRDSLNSRHTQGTTRGKSRRLEV